MLGKFFLLLVGQIYTKKNNNRPESYSEAEKIEFFIKKTYLKFNYQIVEVPKKDINQRIEFILKNI